jgi:F0F1-type ATP synthase membrane subunit b/b'
MRSNWEECVISLTAQLEMVNKRLEKRHKEIQEYLKNNTNSRGEALLLIAEQKAAQTSFQSLEDKIHDMIIYLCRAITLEKINNKEWDTSLFGNTIDS